MNKTICRRLETILHSEVEQVFQDRVFLKPEKSFTNIPVESAEYTCQSQSTNAGTILNETVTAKVKYTGELELLPLKYYVLRLYTDTKEFIVGSPQYPAELTYTHDKIYVNLTFNVTKPL